MDIYSRSNDYEITHNCIYSIERPRYIDALEKIVIIYNRITFNLK